MRKNESHGRIGEAAVNAKCWMHGIRAYNTGGLRANFAGSDLLLETDEPTRKLLVQVKTGYAPSDSTVYLTQCAGDQDLERPKFVADFVVFVNIDRRVGPKHQHDGTLGFEHLFFFVVPRDDANRLYRDAICREYARPLRTGGQRKLDNMSAIVPLDQMNGFRNGWGLIQSAVSARPAV